MRVLLACEVSGRVRDAFIRAGHDAVSCDLLPSLAPGPHIVGDVLDVLGKGWDLVIAFPPCTDLAVSGARYFPAKRADGRQQRSRDFFMRFVGCAPKWAIENPIGIMSSEYRKPDQIVQPWQFGDGESKATCLWLGGLPQLTPTEIVPPVGWEVVRYGADFPLCGCCCEPWCDLHEDHYADCPCIGPTEDEGVTYAEVFGTMFATRKPNPGKPVWKNQTPSGQNKLGPSSERAMLRGLTYHGIANAMASQWGTV